MNRRFIFCMLSSDLAPKQSEGAILQEESI